MQSEAQKRASAKYNSAHTIMVSTKFNRRTEPEIVAYIEAAPSKQQLIKAAIKEYIANHPAP